MDDVSWQQAVGVLTAERERAETAARLIRRFGATAEVARAELTYGDGKAESDALIASLQVALQEGYGADDRPALEQRLQRVAAARLALARQADALLPPAEGEKGLLGDIVKELLAPFVQAVAAVWNRWHERDDLVRATIATQLEAARWRPFASLDAP
jgi:hypothetical protein